MVYTDEAGAVEGVYVKFNHVLMDNEFVPFHGSDGRMINNRPVMSSRHKKGCFRFSGEKKVLCTHPFYKTLIMLENNIAFYPRAMLLVKGVDYDE